MLDVTVDTQGFHGPLVLIAPSYGNPATRSRFAHTLEVEVSFIEGPLRECLNDQDVAVLLRLHPNGAARFWGALAHHNRMIDRLSTGDPVLFTGANHLQAVARIGCRLRNPELADTLWKPEPATGSWVNVYSVLDFQRVQDVRYSDLQVLAGYSPRDVFQGARVPSPERSAALISGLGLDGADQRDEDNLAERVLLTALDSGSKAVPPEAYRTETREYERTARTVHLSRAEARLVARYRETLPDGEAMRLHLAIGWSDLYVVADADLIEAKRSAAHRYVRDALGQLLDYAAHATQPIRRLTALFPDRPIDDDVLLLHTYGIDCLHWRGGNIFERLAAPREARERIAVAWSSMVGA